MGACGSKAWPRSGSRAPTKTRPARRRTGVPNMSTFGGGRSTRGGAVRSTDGTRTAIGGASLPGRPRGPISLTAALEAAEAHRRQVQEKNHSSTPNKRGGPGGGATSGTPMSMSSGAADSPARSNSGVLVGFGGRASVGAVRGGASIGGGASVGEASQAQQSQVMPPPPPPALPPGASQQEAVEALPPAPPPKSLPTFEAFISYEQVSESSRPELMPFFPCVPNFALCMPLAIACSMSSPPHPPGGAWRRHRLPLQDGGQEGEVAHATSAGRGGEASRG